MDNVSRRIIVVLKYIFVNINVSIFKGIHSYLSVARSLSEAVANRKIFMFSVTLFLMLWVHLSFFSREGNPEPQNQKHILDLMNVISEKEKISNWVIYSKVSIILKDLRDDIIRIYST